MQLKGRITIDKALSPKRISNFPQKEMVLLFNIRSNFHRIVREWCYLREKHSKQLKSVEIRGFRIYIRFRKNFGIPFFMGLIVVM